MLLSRRIHSSERATTTTRDGGAGSDADAAACQFDRVLRKLETTRRARDPSLSSLRASGSRARAASSSDHSQWTAFSERDHDDDNDGLLETRQFFVERREGDPHTPPRRSFAEGDVAASARAAAREGDSAVVAAEDDLELLNRNFVGLPDAILRLDERDAIPTPRHKDDILVEIEAVTVDRRDFMVRSGVRCTQSLPQGITTTGQDCIGRVVQLTTHARAVYGISIDDRVAALYPFEYNYGGKDKGRRNKRYALVDAGFAVTVPPHVDAAEAACMVRLYLTGFQAIQEGLSLRDRYDGNQLKGQNVLVDNGQTELGKALIILVQTLGAKVFATGPSEHHSLLKTMGAVPVGSDSFSWELFIEKIGLVLVQDMPTAAKFESFLSILDADQGNIVHIQHSHRHTDGDSFDITAAADDVSCEGYQCDLNEFAEQARTALDSAKLSLKLWFSLRYVVYEGLWPSCKGNQRQFQEDLRYLFTVLSQGNLKPVVNEIVGLEEIAGVQDRIELLGKEGTIVCLPTAIYEKKIAAAAASPKDCPRRDRRDLPPPRRSDRACVDPLNAYASDAGYVTTERAYGDLSDFHCISPSSRTELVHAPKHASESLALSALPEATAYSHPSSHRPTSFGTRERSPRQRATSPGDYPSDASSVVSSVGQCSVTNVSMNRTVFSDGAFPTAKPRDEKDPPYSIQFRNKRTREYRAVRVRARERWGNAPKQKTDAEEHHPPGSPGSSSPSQGTNASSPSSYSTKKLRREARKKQQKLFAPKDIDATKQSAPPTTNAKDDTEETPEHAIVDREDLHSEKVQSEDVMPKTQHNNLTSVSVERKMQMTEEVGGVMSPKTIGHSNEAPRPNSIRHSRPATSKPLGYEVRDSRNDRNDLARDESPGDSSFHALMNKWKAVDDVNCSASRISRPFSAIKT